MNDSEIIDLYLERNEDAVKITSEKYGARLYAIAYGITSDASDAEECENDTYLQAWRLIPPNAPRNYFLSFLSRITRSTALDKCRKKKRGKRNMKYAELTSEIEECIPDTDNVETETDARELGRVIGEFLKQKSVEARGIFMRRYWYMDSIKEISEKFGVSESNVSVILYRTRKELKAYLEKEGYGI